jgi:hypothetical protein
MLVVKEKPADENGRRRADSQYHEANVRPIG